MAGGRAGLGSEIRTWGRPGVVSGRCLDDDHSATLRLLGEDLASDHAVLKGRVTADMGNATMPLVGQVVDDAPRSSGVIDMNAGQRGVLRGSDDGARHVDLRHEGPPRVIAGRVDQDDTVDTMLTPPLSMDLTLLLRRAHQLQHQGDSSRSENLLHPRDEVQEEPFPGETAIVTGDDETDSTGSRGWP